MVASGWWCHAAFLLCVSLCPMLWQQIPSGFHLSISSSLCLPPAVSSGNAVPRYCEIYKLRALFVVADLLPFFSGLEGLPKTSGRTSCLNNGLSHFYPHLPTPSGKSEIPGAQETQVEKGLQLGWFSLLCIMAENEGIKQPSRKPQETVLEKKMVGCFRAICSCF